MRNLARLFSTQYLQQHSASAACICFGPSTFYFALETSLYIESADGLEHLTSFDCNPVCLSMFESQVLFIALENGEMLFLRKGTPDAIGKISDGVHAATWSPDQEILSIITCKNSLILMNRDFDIVFEGPLETDRLGEQFINVGWGKKETQFHGTLGKQAALEKCQIQQQLSSHDGKRPLISWRGDSAFFCCSSVDSAGIRKIRVFDRSGEICSTNEPISSLEHTLAWRPSGNLIASTQTTRSQRTVVFFERNGLRHGEFRLSRTAAVQDLCWNADSSILAVTYADSFVELWTMRNYRWYLKWSGVVKSGETLVKFSWDSSRPLRYCVAYQSGLVQIDELCWKHDYSMDDSNSVVAVVDGESILLTPFARANIPPPSYYSKISDIGFTPVALCVWSRGEDVFVAAAGSSGLLNVYKNGSISFSKQFGACIGCISMSGQDEILVSCLDRIISLELNSQLARETALSCDQITHISGCLFQNSRGQVFNIHQKLIEQFPCFQREFQSYFINSQQYIVACNNGGILSVNNRQVLEDCTSFFVAGKFLLATTAKNRLCFFPFSLPLEQWDSIARGGEEASRRIEPGAVIVVCVPSTSAVVLQMPRGNLETIYPRALTLARIRGLLSMLKYREAYMLCRRMRIDLNVIHDYQPELFASTVAKFVCDIGEADHLNLFLTCLRNENVVATKYQGFLSPSVKHPNMLEKVNGVSKLVLSAIADMPDKYIESIMTAYVVQDPPQYEAALEEIVKLTKKGLDTSIIEKSLKYLIFLADAERLFNVALSLYNLPLALSIAQRSRMNPKEYTPFLESLSAVPLVECRFRIDEYLGRFESAASHLYQFAELDAFVEYVRSHQLYKKALLICKKDEHRKHIYREFGRHLEEAERDCRSALECFVKCGDLEKAYSISLNMGFCSEALYLGHRLKLDASEVSTQVIDVLKSQGRYEDALNIALQYSPKEATDVVTEGCLWSRASQVYAFLGTAVDEKTVSIALEQKEMLKEAVFELERKIQKDFGRLNQVQQSLLQAGEIGEDGDAVGNVVDNLSEMSIRTGSIASLISRANTHKGKKKADRHRMRGKPGSPYEREFLRDSIVESIQALEKIRIQIAELIGFLLHHVELEQLVEVKTGLDSAIERIAVLTKEFNSLQSHLKQKLQELGASGAAIWTDPLQLSEHKKWTIALF